MISSWLPKYKIVRRWDNVIWRRNRHDQYLTIPSDYNYVGIQLCYLTARPNIMSLYRDVLSHNQCHPHFLWRTREAGSPPPTALQVIGKWMWRIYVPFIRRCGNVTQGALLLIRRLQKLNSLHAKVNVKRQRHDNDWFSSAQCKCGFSLTDGFARKLIRSSR